MLISESDAQQPTCIGQELKSQFRHCAALCSLVQRSPDSFKARYSIGRTLGAGEFAVVKAATDMETHEKVAIKLIRLGSNHKRDQLQRELAILFRVSHRNIPKVKEIVHLDSKIAVVMEYAEGGELFHLVQKAGRLSSRQAAGYFMQLLSAVDYLHTIGIVHRDIKLENILMHDDGRILLTDFGFATSYEAGRLLHTACGSPNYAAPEIIFDSLGYDGFAADVWSLGVVLYGMLCGCLPFDDEQHRRLQEAEHEKQVRSGGRGGASGDPDTVPINVRCLYNYIASSPLQFPADQSVDILAVDLLRGLLQPNPLTRLTIQDIWAHPWLTH